MDLGDLLPLAGIGMLMGLIDGAPRGASWWQPLRGEVLIALGVGVLLFLAVRAVSEPVTVGPGGVEVRTRLLGLCLRTRRLPVDLLESVYVEEGQMFHRLVFAGDGFHLQAGRFTSLEAAVAARRAALEALRRG